MMRNRSEKLADADNQQERHRKFKNQKSKCKILVSLRRHLE